MSRTDNNDSHIYFISDASGCSVDRKAGIIKGVSVITGGIKAKGHDLWTDATTLLQMKEHGEKQGTVLVKENHKGPGGQTSGVDAMVGFLTNFRVEGDKTRADFSLYPSHPRRDLYLDAAELTPMKFGLSAAFVPPQKPEMKGGRKMARVDELISVDLVTTPAANPEGLFSAGVDRIQVAMNGQNPPTEPTLADVLQAVTALSAKVTAHEQYFSELAQGDAPEMTLEDLADLSDEDLAALNEQLKAAGQPELSREEIDAAIAEQNGDGKPADAGCEDQSGGSELAALRAQVAELQARFGAQDEASKTAAVKVEFDAIEHAIETLSAENEALHVALAAKGSKAVGHGADVIAFEGGFNGRAQGSYENLVELSVKEGKKPGAAVAHVIANHPEAYQAYLKTRGVRD